MIPLLLALAGPARAAEPPPEPDPHAIIDVTAHPLGARRLRLGFWTQAYGLLDNVDVRTRLPFWGLGLPNAGARITAARTARIDAAFDADTYSASLEGFGVPGGHASFTPLSWTVSWQAGRRLGLHLGQGWWLLRLEGTLDAETMGSVLLGVAGIDVTDDLVSALGEEGGLFAGAWFTVSEAHLAADWRLGPRDTLVFSARALPWLEGLVAGGVAVDAGDAGSTAAGASVWLNRPLDVPGATALAWQHHWRRLHLRLGLPMGRNGSALLAWPAAFQLYWVLGPLPEDAEGGPGGA